MSDADATTSSTGNNPHRLAVFETIEGKRNLLARLTITASDEGSQVAVDGSSEDSARRVWDVIQKLKRERETQAKAAGAKSVIGATRWGGLVEALEREGFGTEEIPAGDYQIKLEIDPLTGHLVGAQDSLHDFAVPDEPLARRLVGSLAEAFKNIPDDLAEKIEAAVAASNPSQVLMEIKRGRETGAFKLFPNERVLAALTSVDIGQFDGDDRRQVREIRMAVAHALERYEIAGAEAEALLHEVPGQFDEQTKAAFEMVVAMATLKKGNKEAALHTWRRLLRPPTALDVGNRAWAWRNISLALSRENPEARHAAKCSADAFLEAGDVHQAGTSLMRLVECLLYEEPASAIKTLDEIVALTDREGLKNRGLRAAAFHARANRLDQLGRRKEAFEDAKEAVALWRGLVGNEEQLISSLHLAALQASAVNEGVEATRFEEEAERLTDEIDKPHFKLARRVMKLAEHFDEGEAAALLLDAERMNNREVIAGVRVIRATRDPALGDTDRLSQLEETLAYLDRSGAREAEKEPAMLALAGELLRTGNADRADEWYQKLLAVNPLNSAAIQMLVNSLWHRKKWAEAIPVIERQIQLRGPLPGFLFAYGRSLYEAGKFSEAVTALTECLKLAAGGSEIEKEATKFRDDALLKGGTILPPRSPQPTTGVVTREDFEKAMEAFARYVSASKRMTFWKKKGGNHVWIERPERHAQTLLTTFLKGRLDDRIELFEELAAGAGRLDIYVQLHGGLSMIMELKMCGDPYSAAYASAGEDQIYHYMDNRECNLGYLIVFDGRLENFGEPLLTQKGPFTVFEKCIDVRPRISKRRK